MSQRRAQFLYDQCSYLSPMSRPSYSDLMSRPDQTPIGDDAQPSQPSTLPSDAPPMTAAGYAAGCAGYTVQYGEPTQNNAATSGTRFAVDPLSTYGINSLQQSDFPNGGNIMLPPQSVAPQPYTGIYEYPTAAAYGHNPLLQTNLGSYFFFDVGPHVDTVAGPGWDRSPAAYFWPSYYPFYYPPFGSSSGNYAYEMPLDAPPSVSPGPGTFAAPPPTNGAMYAVAGHDHPQPALPLGNPAAAMCGSWDSDREWIIPQRPYPRGRHEDTPLVAPAVINVLVSDALTPERLAEPGVLERYQDPAFPDPARKDQKFCVRFEFANLEPNERPTQINEYHKPEKPKLEMKQCAGRRSRREPLSRAELTTIVAKQLCAFLQFPRQLEFRGRPVDIQHLAIVEICRPSAGSVQPKLMIHRNFRCLYAGSTGNATSAL